MRFHEISERLRTVGIVLFSNNRLAKSVHQFATTLFPTPPLDDGLFCGETAAAFLCNRPAEPCGADGGGGEFSGLNERVGFRFR